MRLTPGSIFIAMVALGLPFAVAVGWTLGTPVPPPVGVSSTPAGTGILGSSPSATASAGPLTDVDYTYRPPRRATTRPSAASPTRTPPRASTRAVRPRPSRPVSSPPPAPTPTAVSSAPPSVSAAPPPSTPAGPAGITLTPGS